MDNLNRMKSVILGLGLVLLLSKPNSLVAQISNDDSFVVVIDPGHGGKDPGAMAFGAKEKDLVLSMSKKIATELKNHEDIQVILTRHTDKFIELWRRAQIANEIKRSDNKAGADLFISVHCDAIRNPSIQGAHAFVMGTHVSKRNYEVAKHENSVVFLEDGYEENYPGFNPNDPQTVIALFDVQQDYLNKSIRAAKFIHDRIEFDLKRKVRNIKQAGFLVLHQTNVPSVLFEAGFLTNSNDASYLKSVKGQKEIAKAVADAIVDYRDWVNSNTLVPEDDLRLNTAEIEDYSKGESYRIQLVVSNVDRSPYDSYFKELSPISKESYNHLIRYYYGMTRSLEQAKRYKNDAISRGFKGAGIVKFIDGKRTNEWQ